ncbi:MAG: hypothetical protein OEZ25_03915 [Candidatus Bathyarchaeota archaeon]|nr:hypothetical protein [Candidatus Bathyarchaeota archaeon]
MVESYNYGGRYFSPGYGSISFWSFMATNKNGCFFLEDFWFNQEFGNFLGWYSSNPFFSLYSGWILIFVCQVITVILWCNAWLRWRVPFEEWHALGVVMLPVSTLVLAFYQRIMQYEMTYQTNIPMYSARFHWGFWLAAISVILLFMSFLFSPEHLQFKRWKTLLKKHLRKATLSTICICIVGFFIFNEFCLQTGATKAMYIQRATHAPNVWEDDFNRILQIANLFRARVRYNSPDYCYCYFEVPLPSYRMFAAILHSMGYIAREPYFLHPN